jgi:hypothetical protein
MAMILVAPLVYWSHSVQLLLFAGSQYEKNLKSTAFTTTISSVALPDQATVDAWNATGAAAGSNLHDENLQLVNTDCSREEHDGMNNTPMVNQSASSVASTASPTNSADIVLAIPNLQVQRTDFIYQGQGWDSAPIVVEKYKLVFFTIPKVACTVWKQLLRRMMGYKDWRLQNLTSMMPYNPKVNGLKYLYHYDLANATYFMTSPEYTRAMFVRDPKERFLSAYLDKAFRNNGWYLGRCCRDHACIKRAQSVPGFLRMMKTCRDEHWAPQASRVDVKYWPYMNFIGHMEHNGRDAERLLRRVGAWNKYGRDRWGRYKNESIFKSSHGVAHSTDAVQRVSLHITTPEIEREIDDYYEEDYASPWLNLTKRKVFA